MTSGIARRDGKSRVGFFREAHFILNRLPCVIENTAAPVYNEGKLGIDGFTIVPGQLLNRFLKRFFVSRKGNDQITVGYIAVFFEPNKEGGEHRHVKFVVKDAPTKIKGLIFLQLKGIANPVVGVGGNHVHMGREQYGTAVAAAVSTVAHQQGCGTFIGDYGDVLGIKPCRQKLGLQKFCVGRNLPQPMSGLPRNAVAQQFLGHGFVAGRCWVLCAKQGTH